MAQRRGSAGPGRRRPIEVTVGGDALDRVVAGLDRARRATARRFGGAFAPDLERLRPGDGGTRTAIALEATRSVGLAGAGLAAVDLDPQRAAGRAPAHGTRSDRDRRGSAPGLPRACGEFHGRVLADAVRRGVLEVMVGLAAEPDRAAEPDEPIAAAGELRRRWQRGGR